MMQQLTPFALISYVIQFWRMILRTNLIIIFFIYKNLI